MIGRIVYVFLSSNLAFVKVNYDLIAERSLSFKHFCQKWPTERNTQ